jgi:hypothetical protein
MTATRRTVLAALAAATGILRNLPPDALLR